MLEVKRLMTAVAVAATVSACSGGDGGTEPTPTIDIALSAATLSIVQGANGTVNLTLTRGGGFTEAVAVTVEGAPAGVTATAAPASIATGSTSSVITIAAGGTAAPGTYNLTVRATGTGVTAKTAPVALTVTAAPVQNYSLAVAPSPVSVPQGANGTTTVTITRTGGFAGAVGLAATGLPTGVTAAFSPQSVPGNTNTSTLTLTAAANATVGTSTVTVTGTATGPGEKTATFQLNVTAVTAGSYTIAVTPATVPVVQGATATANVALTRTGGFAGAVTFAVEGLPTGVTGAFNPANTTTDASALTLTAAANATVGGPTTVTVKGTAQGQADKTATFQLNVTAAPVGGFTIALAPTTLPVQQGGTGTSTVTITRTNGFAGAVTLTATGLPNGVTAAFNPPAPTTNTSTLTLTASPTATVGGPTTVTVRGNSGTLTEQTATLALTVTAATGGSGNTTWEFCSAAETPLWLAVQDGNGAWSRVTPTGTKFQFNIAAATGGVAFVNATSDASIAAASRTLARRMSVAMEAALLMQNKAVEARASRTARYAARARSLVDGFDLTIVYGTQAELNAQGTSYCLTGSGKTVNGTVANVAATQTAEISLGDAFTSVSGGTTTFQLTDVPDGALDLVASRGTFDLNTFTSTVDKLIIRRGVNPANNSTLPVLDFNAAEAFAPAQANLTVGNLGGDTPIVTTTYFTASGTSGAGLFNGFGTGPGPFKYYGVPTDKQIAGDLHFAFVLAGPASENADNARLAGLFFKDPTDRTVTLGAVLPTPAVTVAATTPYVRLRAQGSATAAYNKYVQVSYTQATAARVVSIGASAAYLANATTYDFTIPDFTGAAGWDNNWGLKAGAETQWTVSGIGFTGIGVDSPNPVEGSTVQAGLRFGTITP
jgi:hypothetical protein